MHSLLWDEVSPLIGLSKTSDGKSDKRAAEVGNRAGRSMLGCKSVFSKITFITNQDSFSSRVWILTINRRILSILAKLKIIPTIGLVKDTSALL
jgi:hypothetical protein